MAKQAVPINGEVLKWAREEAALSVADLAALMKVEPADVSSWERGESKPSRGQFTRVVVLLRRPSSIFFLPEPPRASGLPTSFRRAPGLKGHQLQRDKLRLVRWARRLQGIVEWAARDAGQPAVSIPRFETESFPEEAAGAFRGFLDISVDEQLAWASPSEAMRSWRGRLEELGIIVVQLSLGREAIRGFCVWSDYAPLVAVNTAYHPTARIYTLFHECGHLVTRRDSACFDFIAPNSKDDALERWCERFAAAALLPREAVRTIAAGRLDGNGKITRVDDSRSIANKFKTSTRALSLRLNELGLADGSLYGAVTQALARYEWNTGGGGKGQPRTQVRLGQVGLRAATTLLEAARQGRLHERDVADHLRLSTGEVSDLRSMVAG